MKLFILFTLVVLLFLAKFGSSVPVIYELEAEVDNASPKKEKYSMEWTSDLFLEIFKAWKEWSEWKDMHKKDYESLVEEINRFKVWLDNRALITSHNSDSTNKHTLGMNEFGDLTHEEFTKMYLGNGHKMKHSGKGLKYLPPLGIDVNSLPEYVNWAEEGYVTSVKNQGQCGSCWSFSATGALEGQLFRENGSLIPLSEQNLLDCSSDYGNQGCDGGLMDYAFEYIKVNGGIDTEASYPYEGVESDCRYDENNRATGVANYVDITSGDEDELMIAVANEGPVSIAVDASRQEFQFYRSGIYNDDKCSSQELDHGVLAVGYGTGSSGNTYWLIKNSWGSSWGESGYIKIAKDKNNMCGVATVASYPIVQP